MKNIILLLFFAFSQAAFAGSSTRTVDADVIKSSDHAKTWTMPGATGTVSCISCTESPTSKTFAIGSNTWTGQFTVANGGTGLSSGTSGGIPYFNSSSTMASSGALTSNQLIVGGGAGASPASLAAGTQYQSLVMGAANPGYSAVPLNQAAAISGTLPTGNGGTGVTSVTTSPTASSFAGWDANSNLSANNHIEGYATTATAAGTTTLTVASKYLQYFTGVTTQTVVLPVASTLVLGFQFQIVNNSTGVVTVQSSGANAIQAMAGNGSAAVYTCILTSGTTAASWSVSYSPPMVSTNTASTGVLRDASGNFSAGTISAAVTGTASGNTTYTANNHGVVISGAGNAMTVIAPDASTTKALISGGASADPVWGTLAIASGGTGQTTAANAINALVPTQTSNSGKYLTTDGSVVSWGAQSATALAVVSKTADYTATTSDDAVIYTTVGADRTLTLYTAVGNTGKVIRVSRTDTANNAVIVDPNASETIEGATTYKLYGQYSYIVLISDGANWQVLAKAEDNSLFYTTTAGQSIANNTTTIIDYGTAVKTMGFAVTTGASWAATTKTPGTYSICAHAQIALTAAGAPANLSLYKNGSVFKQLDRWVMTAAVSDEFQLGGCTDMPMATGDTFDIRILQVNGGAKSMGTGATVNYVSARKVGDNQ